MRSNALIVGSLFITAALLVGCSSGGASASAPAAATAAPVSAAPASEAPASAPASAAASAAEGAATVEAKPVGAAGTVLVDGDDGMTVYIFTKDVKDSGKSACTGDCLDDVAGADRGGRCDTDRGDRRDRQARDDHPRRRDAPGHL